MLATTSVAENVALGLVPAGVSGRERRARAGAELEALGLADVAGRRPQELSGGQRQRVAVARATVHRPSLVLADEPTASVDGATGALVLAHLRALVARGAAVLIGSHDPAGLADADQRLRCHGGRLAP